ncbi:MAG: hypothetical protein H7Z40_00165 [Phycisphaerae bacterium]|nr:hypothetical protein [Gemmatimonadaceae bacterium]
MSETNPKNSRVTASPSAAFKSAPATGSNTSPRRLRSASVFATLVALAVVSAAVTPRAGNAYADNAKPGALMSGTAPRSTAATRRLVLGESLLGRSKKLRVRFVSAARSLTLPIVRELFGDSASDRAGLYAARTDDLGETFHFITMRPFTDKIAGRIGSYNIGFFPSERRSPRGTTYSNPEGFIEVSNDNQFTPVSQHFTLSDFLTHDQARVWPKYLVLREPLLDKLELVIAELGKMGVPVKRMKVMSGFRTPQYNQPGVGAGGRAKDSRHQFGDAADVYVVNGARDWMSDINRDGKVDTRDAKFLALAAERVEQAHPDLIGGIGIYPATSAHGPFVHIDVRGVKARW